MYNKLIALRNELHSTAHFNVDASEEQKAHASTQLDRVWAILIARYSEPTKPSHMIAMEKSWAKQINADAKRISVGLDAF